MNQKLISVIVPVYNAEQFISETIRSILNQTYTHLELILVNDGSSDKSESIIKEWSMKDDRIKSVNQHNQGPSVTRNTALDHSTGDYVLFVDADDEIKSNTLEQLVKRMSETDLLIFGYENHFDREGEKNNLILPHKEAQYSLESFLPEFGRLFKDNLIHYVWNKCYTKEVIEDIRFDEGIKVGEDLLFNLEIMAKARTVSVSKEVLYIHNWYNSESITTKYHEQLFDYRKLQFEKVRDFLMNYHVYSEANRKIIEKQFFKKYLACLVSLESKEADLTGKEKKRRISQIARVSKEHQLLTYTERTYWEKLVVFLMKHQFVTLLMFTTKGLKIMQDKRRQH